MSALENVLNSYLPYYILTYIDEYMSIGNTKIKIWKDFLLAYHRSYDKPAFIEISSNAVLKAWYIHNERHRMLGPSYTYDTYNFHTEIWLKYGKRHRLNGPAFIKYKDGKLLEAVWYKNDVKHRLNGPAVIEYSNGKKSTEFWLYGRRIHENVID
jgi:hypothetical protein